MLLVSRRVGPRWEAASQPKNEGVVYTRNARGLHCRVSMSAVLNMPLFVDLTGRSCCVCRKAKAAQPDLVITSSLPIK